MVELGGWTVGKTGTRWRRKMQDQNMLSGKFLSIKKEKNKLMYFNHESLQPTVQNNNKNQLECFHMKNYACQ